MTRSSKPRRQRPLIRTQVISTQWLTPRMVRVVVGGEDLRSYVHNDFTDRYVKLVFLRPGVTYAEPWDLILLRALPPEERPAARTYTVRSYDPERRQLTFDFVVHADQGDEGIAAAWASRAEPGDELFFAGPGPSGAYAPNPAADWHLFVGDESAIPAIGAALEQLPAGVPAYLFLEVENAAEEQELPTDAKAEFSWFHRSTSPRPPRRDLVDAVTSFAFPDGELQAFVHGEAGIFRDLRHHLFVERAVPRDRVSISGYWRRGKTEDGWRAEKAEEARREGR